MQELTIVGAGLAGSEAALQMSSRGWRVRLIEMRPSRMTPAHTTADFAEIVCSNSFGTDEAGAAPALLKEELRALGSSLLRIADSVRVPAGKALAVDRQLFRRRVTEAIESDPMIDVVREELQAIPAVPSILATGPLTSDAFAAAIENFTGRQNLNFQDASSPIVLAETVNRDIVFQASRYGRGSDYLNCPFDRERYVGFREALITAESAVVHELDRVPFFEGCLPIEELARRGEDTMRFGPLKPIGLPDPRTGALPYAVVQLRQDDIAAEHYNLVGFQSRLKWGEQKRVFRMIPGLETAEFVSFGKVHRNLYINAPVILTRCFEARRRAGLFIAGTLAGVEGYTECIASGIVAAMRAADASFEPPPPTTGIGALCRYIEQADWKNYQPVNFSFGLLDPLERTIRQRDRRRAALVERARTHFAEWLARTHQPA